MHVNHAFLLCNKPVNVQSSIIIFSLNRIMHKSQFPLSGEFGIVYCALCTHKSDLTGVPQPVAVKTLKGLSITITLLILQLVHIM